jgi:hypothetical protein
MTWLAYLAVWCQARQAVIGPCVKSCTRTGANTAHVLQAACFIPFNLSMTSDNDKLCIEHHPKLQSPGGCTSAPLGNFQQRGCYVVLVGCTEQPQVYE